MSRFNAEEQTIIAEAAFQTLMGTVSRNRLGEHLDRHEADLLELRTKLAEFLDNP